jgi:hypothetical protein
LEECNWILEVGEQGVDSQFVTEIRPELPVAVGFGSTLSSNAGSHGFLCKLNVMVERVLGVGVQSFFQYDFCG